MMKKICLLVAFLVLGKMWGYGQYTIQQFIGADSAIVTSKGGLQGRLIPIVITDTNAANAQRIKSYPGAQLYTTSGDFYIRNYNATKWVLISSGSSGPLNIYNSDGTLTGNRILTGANNNLTFTGLKNFNISADSTIITGVASMKNRVQMSGLPSAPGTKALRIDANGTLSIADTSGGLSGSGTTNYIPKFTSSSSVGNSNIYQSSSGSIGIGTNNPLSFPDYTTLAINNSINGGLIDFLTNGTSKAQIFNDSTDFYLLTSANVPFSIYTSASERMRITAGGNVGIGTNTPDSMLTVSEGVYFQRGVRMSGLPSAPGVKQLRIDANGVLSAIDTSVAGSGTVTSVATNDGTGIKGGTITTTGTLYIDTTIIATTANLSGGLAGKLNISDTAAMLSPYLRKVDTASLSNRINLKLNISDTSAMLQNYVNNVGYGLGKTGQTVYADSATLSNYYLRRKDSLTATNSLGYVTKTVLADTAAAIRGSIPAVTGYVPYVGATQNLNLGQNGLLTEFVTFDTTSRAVTARTLQWSNDNGTLQFGMTNGGTLTQNIGLQQFARVKNVQGTQINKGQAVYIYGASGDRASVKLAYNKADSNSSKTLGVAAEDIPANDVGLVGTFGTISNLNLSTFAPGDILYLDSIPGGLTATKPQAPYHIVFIGVVERANSGNGLLFVNPQNGYELDELHNVKITSPVRNNAILVYDSVANLWVDTTISQAGLAVTSVATNTATGITGGTITTTGTLAIDTLLISTRAWRQKGIDSVAALANTKVGGSGTTNYVSKFTASGTIGNSIIYDSLGSVGINNTNPSAYGKLSVVGTKSVSGVGDVSAHFGNGTNSSIYISHSGSGAANILTDGLQPLTFGTNSVEAMRIVSNGNVLVNTTSNAGYKFDINGDLRTVQSAYVATSSGSLGVATTSPDSTLMVNGGVHFNRGVRASGLPQAPGTKALRIDASGTISIADTLVDAGGTVTSVATNTGTGITGGTITTSGTLAIDTLLLSTRAWRQKGIDSVAALLPAAISGTTNYIPKFTSSSAIGNSVIYDASGSIGIGTITPAYKLVVNSGVDGISAGIAGSTYGIRFDNGGTFSSGMSTIHGVDNTLVGSYQPLRINGSDLRFAISASEGMRLTSTGLGIGTSSPDTKLNIVGANTAFDGYGQLSVYSNSAMGADVGGSIMIGGAWTTGGALTYFGSIQARKENSTSGNVAGYLQFGTTLSNGTHTEKMRLDASGNLGLGVTPSAWSTGSTLDISTKGSLHTSSSIGLMLGRNVYYDGSYKYKATGIATALIMDDGGYNWNIAPSGTAGNAISFTQAMTLDASGNLGIGTTSPDVLLHVSGTTGTSKIASTSTTAGNYPYLIFFHAGNDEFRIGGGDGLRFLSSGTTERMRITSGGNVGIGTTSPSSILHLYKASEPEVYYQSSAATWRTGLSSDNNFYVYTSNAKDFYVSTNGSERMRITSGGNVLVGTTTDAGYKLQIDGNVYVRTLGNGYAFAGGGATTVLKMYGSATTIPSLTSYIYFSNSDVAPSSDIASINGSTGAYTALSDSSKKKDFEPSTLGLSAVLGLKPTLYRMKNENDGIQKHLGFLAQEVKNYIPQAYVDNGKFIGLDYNAIIPVLVNAIKELKAEIEVLKNK